MSEGNMTISVEQVKKLIEDYWGYERECSKGYDDPVAFGRAALYRTVIMDLEKLLPRKSMADVDPRDWDSHVGSWGENDGAKRVIVDVNRGFSEHPIVLFDPLERASHVADPNDVFPLDEISPVWDSEGNPA